MNLSSFIQKSLAVDEWYHGKFREAVRTIKDPEVLSETIDRLTLALREKYRDVHKEFFPPPIP